MTGKKKIQDRDTVYEIIRLYAGAVCKTSYRISEVYGRENIPQDGAVIFTPNHTSALTDAFSVLFMSKGRKVFVARADIFRNSFFANILYFFKLMPINRIRDGKSNMAKNADTFSKATSVLMDRVPFVIFPEGTHRAMHSIIHPLQKGVFRIAHETFLKINSELSPEKRFPVYIVPIGIEYGNYFRIRSTKLIHIGKAIDTTSYFAEGICQNGSESELYNRMREDLQKKMRDLILYVPDNEAYNCLLDLCRILSHETAIVGNMDDSSLSGRHKANKETLRILETSGNLSGTIAKYGERIFALRQRHRIRICSITRYLYHDNRRDCAVLNGLSIWNMALPENIITRTAILLLLLPYQTVSLLFYSPLLLCDAVIAKNLEDTAFISSIRMFLKLTLWPMILICSFFINSFLPLFLWFAPSFIYDYGRNVRIAVSDMKIRKNKELKKLLSNTLNEYKTILNSNNIK